MNDQEAIRKVEAEWGFAMKNILDRCNGCMWLWDGGGDSYWYSCWHPDGHHLEEIGGWFGLKEHGREPIIQRPEWCPLKCSTNSDSPGQAI